MLLYLIVALGSAAGGVCRYAVAELVAPRLIGHTSLPLHTLLVNFVGCYILTLVHEAVLGGLALRPATRLLLTTGFCGGLTTYSTFNYETARLFTERGLPKSAVYAAATIGLCLLAHLLGLLTARAFAR